MESTRAPSEARARILETADALFYQHGIRAVGIDRIIAEAGVAKMSLYKHFASKDDLILAVLQYREQKVLAFFAAAMERHSKRQKDRVRVFFAALKDWFSTPDFRGCAFQNAAIELADPNHAGAQFARDHKQRFSSFITGIVTESVGKASVKLASAVGLLVEGAIMTAVVQGTTDAVDVARDAALTLLTEASRS